MRSQECVYHAMSDCWGLTLLKQETGKGNIAIETEEELLGAGWSLLACLLLNKGRKGRKKNVTIRVFRQSVPSLAFSKASAVNNQDSN